MTSPARSSDASNADVSALFALVAAERLARDSGDWSALADSYWPGARVRVTWFDGSAEEFIEKSRESVRPGAIGGFHDIVPVRAELRADRALVESRGRILLRPRVEGVECDLTSWCRFVAGAERRGGAWRITFFDSIYIKDRIDPVLPGAAVSLDLAAWESYRASYRFLAYTNRARGILVPDDLPGIDRPDLIATFWATAREWLHAE